MRQIRRTRNDNINNLIQYRNISTGILHGIHYKRFDTQAEGVEQEMIDKEQFAEVLRKKEGIGMDKKDCVNYRDRCCVISADYVPRCGRNGGCSSYQTEEDMEANGYIGMCGKERPSILIGMPNMGTVKDRTVASLLAMDKTTKTKYCMVPGSLIYDARDLCVHEAVEGGFEYLMFIDSDIEFGSDAMLRLLAHDKDIITGIYYKRGGEHDPVIYKKIAPLSDEREVTCVTETDVDRELFEIAGCGMGFCLIKTSVLKDLLEDAPSVFTPILGLGEDLSFCYRATQKGYKIWADGTIQLNHWGEIAFGRASFNKEKFEHEHVQKED